jgi:hypothetical protein
LDEGEMRRAKCEVFNLSRTLMYFGNGFDRQTWVEIRYAVCSTFVNKNEPSHDWR